MRPPRGPIRPMNRVRRRWWYLFPPLMIVVAVLVALALVYLIGMK